MPKPVISVEHLTKSYDLGVIGTGTLSRDLNRWWARVRKQPDPYTRIGQRDAFERIGESILALDDVSFTVEQGEALGIIGRNGAGKSTLLKILSRVTAPTSGVVKVKGRIGSLLEVGTGFHPELTGRENIYLNGAILGMKKAEVVRKFDEIVDFSGVEKFIDTPVKRYSSGMYVRLAFAVAAHLDPEILIVDEVLAVGDAEFQKKCLGKMGDVASEGRTVLFVSHNMGAIHRLCNRGVLLKEGALNTEGEINLVVQNYINDQNLNNSLTWTRHTFSNDETLITQLMLLDEEQNCRKAITNADQIHVMVVINNGKGVKNLQLSLDLLDNFGNLVFVTSPRDCLLEIPSNSSISKLHVFFKDIFLLPVNYTLRANLYVPPLTRYDRQHISFTVGTQNSFSNYLTGNRSGFIAPKFEWKIVP